MSKIVKSSSVLVIVSITRTTSKSLAELLNSSLIFLLIVGGIFAHSQLLAYTNITSGFYVEVDKERVSLCAVNDKCITRFVNKDNIFLFNRLYKNEENKRINIESFKEHPMLNYNQASFILTDITYPLEEEEKEKSDLFYYILGILILIISAFILRQRYKQYLEEKNKLNR